MELRKGSLIRKSASSARFAHIGICVRRRRRRLRHRRKSRPARTSGATKLKDATKNFGDAHRVPFVVACCSCLVLLAAFLLCFLFGCHGSILPFHSSWNFATGVLLQLFECIESARNEVKRKMIETVACNAAPKSLVVSRAKKFAWSQIHSRHR